MMDNVYLTVRTLEKVLFSGQVAHVELPGSMGRFQVLLGHAPLVGKLAKGVVHYTQEGKQGRVLIRGGMVEVRDNKVKVWVSGH